jgi:hypothetical protein
MKKISILLSLIICMACDASSFFIENNFNIPVNNLTPNNSLRELYQKEINSFLDFYNDPDLIIDFEWGNPKVNAYASRIGKLKKIRMLGGLARHKQMNMAVFQTILCHELGHHYSGTPYKSEKELTVEGKSDYFAINQCIKKYIAHKNHEEFLKDYRVSKLIKKTCTKEDFLCQRLYVNSLLTAQFARKLRQTSRGNRYPVPQIDRTDSRVVTVTLESHPDPQCRLDTYIKGLKDTSDTGNYPSCWYAQ